MEFCECGSIKVIGVCSNRHCEVLNNKNRKWIINGVEIKFKTELTKAQAIKAIKEKSPLIVSGKDYKSKHKSHET